MANGIENGYEINKEDKGFIIVETNYRIYAYTGIETSISYHLKYRIKKNFASINTFQDSQLQISLLALFSDLLYKFPNMVVGSLTRESLRQAYKVGITSQQVGFYVVIFLLFKK